MGSPSSRSSLARHVVLDAALALIDREGLDGLTIRALGRELGRPTMTLYTHFDSKHELLDLAFERLLHRLFSSRHGSSWQEEFEGGCGHLRCVLLEHPHWIALLTRVQVPPPALDVYNRLLGLMSKDGFRPEAAMFAFSSVMSHALGSVLVQRMMGSEPSIPRLRLELVKGRIAEMPRGSYPSIKAVALNFDRWSYEDVFKFGCQSLIAGLDERCTRRDGGRRGKRRPA